jgi:hypothetical protein
LRDGALRLGWVFSRIPRDDIYAISTRLQSKNQAIPHHHPKYSMPVDRVKMLVDVNKESRERDQNTPGSGNRGKRSEKRGKNQLPSQ